MCEVDQMELQVKTKARGNDGRAVEVMNLV